MEKRPREERSLSSYSITPSMQSKREAAIINKTFLQTCNKGKMTDEASMLSNMTGKMTDEDLPQTAET